MENVLLVEDDFNFGTVLASYLELNNYNVTHCTSGTTGLSAIKTKNFDLCIFDIMLPGMDGFTLASEMKQFKNEVPFVFLTAKTLKEDMIKGYQLGADDYITKPFDTELLLLKIKAVLQRSKKNKATEPDEFVFRNFHFRHSHRTLQHGETHIKLSPREADLLKQLCLHQNDLLNKDKALKIIWGDNSYFNARSMDVYITKLRKYLSVDKGIEIVSVHGSGYRFVVS
ncbi:MAG: DNA-binding response regulator [Bacteroidetes bacterium HGW-Bacteroidetes-21]|jgi:DNA-binding response OmpR family regulator|nr:MAG: DNA-binding response regulator [Bacteroidetes bacterium HGW-Bacteroidetes-21]